MFRTSRTAELWIIALSLAAVAAALLVLGFVLDSPMLKFGGFMTGASTFVPMPADAYVLAAAETIDPWMIGVVGGIVNGLVVLVEGRWVSRLTATHTFDRFVEFVGTNRYVDLAQQKMFLGLVVGGASFLPFEPFRLVAILRNYSPTRYFAATAIGRGFRYYCLAEIGAKFADLGAIQYVIWISMVVFAIGVFRSYRRFAETK